MLWTDGERYIPVDYRMYDKAKDGLPKNDHFRPMLQVAGERGFEPECVIFDSWYAALPNLKLIRSFQWRWLTRLEHNRHVNSDRRGNCPLNQIAIAAQGTIVHQGLWPDQSLQDRRHRRRHEYWVTNDLEMDELMRLKFAELGWMIETYHRGIKQFCGTERCQARSATAQRNHVELALRAFLRLEYHCFVKGLSWFEAKTVIIRDAVRAYLAKPVYTS